MKSSLVIRDAWQDELPRIKEVLEHQALLPSNVQFLLGVIERPVEHIHCLLSWWYDADSSGVFFLPQSATTKSLTAESCTLLIRALIEKLPSRVSRLSLAIPLSDVHELTLPLEELGFSRSKTERNFQTSYWALRQRFSETYQRLKPELLENWEVKCPPSDDAPWMMELFQNHGLITPQLFHSLWHAAQGEQMDKETSCIAYFKGKPVAGLLTTRHGEKLYIAAIACSKKSLSGYASILLMYHLTSASSENLPTVVTFRADEAKHDITIRFAGRTDAVEAPPVHEFSLAVQDFKNQS